MNLRNNVRTPTIGDTSMESVPPIPRKPNIKDVRCSTFKGDEVYRSLGAEFEISVHEFEHAIHTESLVNGKASRHFHKKNAEWQRKHGGTPMSYAALTKSMLDEFGCKLGQMKLHAKMHCHKRDGDSWNEFLEYLKFIEGLMDGDQSKLALKIFYQNACPEQSGSLLANVNEAYSDYLAEADQAMSLLYRMLGDGRKYSTRKQGKLPGRCNDKNGDRTKKEARDKKQPHRGHRPHGNKPRGNISYQVNNEKWQRDRDWRLHSQGTADDDSSSRFGEGNAANGAATKKKCYVCMQWGHKADACAFVSKAIAQAQAVSASAASGAAQADDNSDDEAHIWMATPITQDTDDNVLPGSSTLVQPTT
ncbi:TPA: hypothetical protein N0F65_005018 [Lagenidium giganteum]|uniref:Uncharacterized protein n=1 Tax=Lagenidium giganteum TaxID=4803 RepID=A0AAV2ZE08_9STRA|nr:TPA: hypothetical protein N0F65_005018 [Lagenidium giganteum]